MESTLASLLIDAAESARWAVLAGGILMALIWVFRRVTAGRLPARFAPLIAAGVAVVVSVAGGLIGGAEWYDALLTGLLVGGAASGFWSLVGKHLLPPPPA